jgi:glycosyltransferase involved in cell wall biosynthesis
VDALTTAVRALLEDPQQRQQMGEAAQREVAERFTVEAMASRYAEQYRRLLQVHR